MFNHLSLKNFKCFNQQTFKFTELTVFCGANSVGKSTALQAVLLVAQNFYKHRLEENKVDFNGEYFSFGTLKDLQSHSPTDAEVLIELDVSRLSIDCSFNDVDAYSATVKIDKLAALNLFKEDFVYLAAERIGPRNSHHYNYDVDGFSVGIYGQYAFSQYFKLRGEPCANQPLALQICKHLEKGSGRGIKVEIALKEAMKKIAPNFDIKVDSIASLDQVIGTYPSSGANDIRPINVGFGLSYIFPIVLAGVCIKPGGTLIVENPEVHLHPEAQSNLAQFLSMVSQHGVQVIIETHSDHILNGVRIFAKENQVEPGRVTIHSVSLNNSGRQVKEILLDEDARFTELEPGFFDQIEKDLLRLF